MANIVSAQMCTNATTVCAGATFEVCKTNYTQSVAENDYGLVLVLTAEGATTILQSSGDVADGAQACFTFNTSNLPIGTYQVRALNYDATTMGAGLPINVGDNVDAISATDVCYNSDFLMDVRCYEVVALPVATEDCALFPNGALIDVYPTDMSSAGDILYSLNGGPFQSDNRFVVMGEDIADTYIITTMNTVTGCTYEFEADCMSLPLELTAFKGTCMEGNYVLNWTTSSERDISHFNIERSNNGTDYSPVGRIAAAGNSTTIQNYVFQDETAGLSRYYYRLHIVETTGIEEYSPTVTVECKTGSFGILDIHPNPTRDLVMIAYETTGRQHITLKIGDVLGRTLHKEVLTPDLGLNTKTLDLSELSSAVYIILMDDGTRQIVKRIVRE